MSRLDQDDRWLLYIQGQGGNLLDNESIQRLSGPYKFLERYIIPLVKRGYLHRVQEGYRITFAGQSRLKEIAVIEVMES